MVKKILRKKKEEEKLPSRITNDTVAQHREKVLAGGRKHKYPIQYTRAKLVRNTIIISTAALVVLVGLIWAQLYVFKDTSDFAYRVTKVIPLPVAKIDGQFVRYSDYLLYHRSTMTVLENQGRAGEDLANDRLKFKQDEALGRALDNAYVQKLARERNISVSDQQVSELIERQRKESNLSESAYEDVVNDHFHWTMDELKQVVKSTILRQEVAFSIDDEASKTTQTVGELISGGKSFEAINKQLGEAVQYQPNFSAPEGNSDGGLSEAATKLKVGEVSSVIKPLTGDGYYFIQRQKSQAGNVAYSYIKVPLRVLNSKLDDLKKSDKTIIYIKDKND